MVYFGALRSPVLGNVSSARLVALLLVSVEEN